MAKKAKRAARGQMTPPVLQPDAAGIDIGATEIYVAVPPDRAAETVRSFGTFTPDLVALADWLQACGIRTVAMESTGVFWIPLFQILEKRGLEVCLVNARHVKNVPGRKTDVLDCQWLQYLHSVGLLHASFRPQQAVCSLRVLTIDRRCDQEIQQQMAAFESRTALPAVDSTRKLKPRREAEENLRNQHWRVLGVDLTEVPGISSPTVQVLLAEIGPDWSKFRSASALASWLGLCPHNEISGGQVLSSKTRKVKNRAATALRLAAQSLHHSYSYLGEYYRRMRAKLGAPKAIVAAAHKLARILYHLLTTGHAYQESIFAGLEAKSKQRAQTRLETQARLLGFRLTPLAG